MDLSLIGANQTGSHHGTQHSVPVRGEGYENSARRVDHDGYDSQNKGSAFKDALEAKIEDEKPKSLEKPSSDTPKEISQNEAAAERAHAERADAERADAERVHAERATGSESGKRIDEEKAARRDGIDGALHAWLEGGGRAAADRSSALNPTTKHGQQTDLQSFEIDASKKSLLKNLQQWLASLKSKGSVPSSHEIAQALERFAKTTKGEGSLPSKDLSQVQLSVLKVLVDRLKSSPSTDAASDALKVKGKSAQALNGVSLLAPQNGTGQSQSFDASAQTKHDNGLGEFKFSSSASSSIGTNSHGGGDFSKFLSERFSFSSRLVHEVSQLAQNAIKEASVRHSGVSSQAIIRLDPPELGSMRLQITVEENSVRVHVAVSDESVRRLVELQLSQLRQSLASNGLTLTECEVGVSNKDADPHSQLPFAENDDSLLSGSLLDNSPEQLSHDESLHGSSARDGASHDKSLNDKSLNDESLHDESSDHMSIVGSLNYGGRPMFSGAAPSRIDKSA